MINALLSRYAQNSSRVHLERYNRRFAESVPAGALVLDAAAGMQPYRKLFDHAQYEAADFEMVDKGYAKSTYVCDLTSIPVKDSRFDAILFNQGLEHMPNPENVLMELNRVMKSGGKILISAPLFYEEHEQPYDFFRYTQFAYKIMLPKAGFNIDSIEKLEGYLGTVGYQLESAAKYLPKTLILAPVRLFFTLLAIIFYRSDIKNPYKKSGFPKNYVVVATKI